MLKFQYKAATTGGDVVNGDLLAATRDSVIRELQNQGLTPIRVDEVLVAHDAPKRRWLRRESIPDRQIADMTRELGSLLEAGLPLDRSLSVLASLTVGPTQISLIDELRGHIKGGSSLADAMAERNDVFNPFYTSLVRAGEASGALDAVLKRLADHLERIQETRSAIISALFYPAVLVVVAVIAIAILLGYVVPQFTQMFEDVGQALPLSTRIVIAVGEFVRAWGWTLPPAIGGCYWYLQRQLADPAAKRRWHSRVLGIPVVGGFIVRIEVGRFARTLGTLLTNGVSLLEAITIARATLGNEAIAHCLDRVDAGLRGGRRFADTLDDIAIFPAFTVNLIRVGEESGELPDMLERIAMTYERDTNVQLKRMVTLLEPVLILVLGGIIAGVIISILMAIMGINDLVF